MTVQIKRSKIVLQKTQINHMNKKNILTIVFVIIVIGIMTMVVIYNKNNSVKDSTVSESEIMINDAIKSDTTTDINSKLDDIKIEEDIDMVDIDNELNNL